MLSVFRFGRGLRCSLSHNARVTNICGWSFISQIFNRQNGHSIKHLVFRDSIITSTQLHIFNPIAITVCHIEVVTCLLGGWPSAFADGIKVTIPDRRIHHSRYGCLLTVHERPFNLTLHTSTLFRFPPRGHIRHQVDQLSCRRITQGKRRIRYCRVGRKSAAMSGNEATSSSGSSETPL